ncbi:DUF4019 domain-containing protein [Novosphingobium sp. Leaf2]|uniref:DUF4019 domain-containing protein n=1 Tax=Novosphingobium sp. Leaf2 TaxID=1735670 RepID=UPI0006FAF86A|nr:DUF4019 domain-containing protein [Novosphingobium sp. Leaf2]KQM18817.1 hypothetical protein ASE49_06670 [Novosphingobium sp. Leaf2]
MTIIARTVLVVLAASALAACNVQESIRNADAEVAQFHRSLDAGSWGAVWDSSDPALRQATPRAQWVKLLEAVHRKLGNVKSTKQVGWNANTSTNGSFVTVTTETVFERGKGTEQFVFHKGEADKLALVGYSIQSQDMMLN